MEKETIIKTNPQNSESLKVKGVTKKQLKILQSGKLPLAVIGGLVAGIGSQFAFANASDSDELEDELIEDNISESEISTDNSKELEELFDFEAPTTIAFSESVNDDMSFGEAFSAARSEMGPGGFFNWNGSSYHTLNKEEWDALSSEERDEYTQQIKDNTNFEDGTSNKVEPSESEDIDVSPDDSEDSNEKNDDNSDDTLDKEEDSEESIPEDREDSNEKKDEEEENDETLDKEEDSDIIIPEDEQEFADLDEIITEEELLADLNQEDAFDEEDGTERIIEEEEFETLNEEIEKEEDSDESLLEDLNDDANNLDYDPDFGDDLIEGTDDLDELDLNLD